MLRFSTILKVRIFTDDSKCRLLFFNPFLYTHLGIFAVIVALVVAVRVKKIISFAATPCTNLSMCKMLQSFKTLQGGYFCTQISKLVGPHASAANRKSANLQTPQNTYSFSRQIQHVML
jgi:hypothetical protein